MQYLKADTSVKVVIGPFVDVGDAFTPETGITLAAADEAELLKHDNATTVDISGNTWAAIAGVDGYYNLTLTSGNTDTEGHLTVVVQDDSVCLPVRNDFMVVNANVYDSLFAAAGTDTLDVQVTGMGANVVTSSAMAASAIDSTVLADNAITAAKIQDSAITAAKLATNAITSAKIATGAITTAQFDSGIDARISDAIWDEALSGHVTNGTAGAYLYDSGRSYFGGTMQAGSTSTTAVLESGAVTFDNQFNGCRIRILSGTAIGQTRLITASTAASDTVTVDRAWESTKTPAVSDDYVIIGADADLRAIEGSDAAADNFLAMYDGTGYAGGTTPLDVNVTTVAGTAQTANDNGADLNTLITNIGTPSDLGSGATIKDNLADMAGATFSNSTDSLEAIRDQGDSAWTTAAAESQLLLQDGTITVNSQTEYVLSAGSADNDAYNGCIVVITDQSTSTQKAVLLASDYVGATKTLTVAAAPGFTVANGDLFDIIASPMSLPAAVPAANGGLATVDANNRIVGVQGTKNTFDDLNDLTAAQVNTEADTALTDYDPPTRTELTTDINSILTRLGTPAGADVSADIAAVKADTAATLLDTGTDGVVVAAASKSGYALSAAGIDSILDEAITEPSGVFAWGSATLRNIVGFLGAVASNKITQTSSVQTLRNRADTVSIATASVSDDGTTATKASMT